MGRDSIGQGPVVASGYQGYGLADEERCLGVLLSLNSGHQKESLPPKHFTTVTCKYMYTLRCERDGRSATTKTDDRKRQAMQMTVLWFVETY